MSEPRVLQIVHDHPAFTSGGTEWVAHDLTLALVRRGAPARLLAATTSLSRPDAAPGSLEALGDDLLLRTGRYDAFAMTRDDGTAWTEALGRVLAEMRPDIVHLHGLDRIGSEVVAFVRAHRPRARIVMTLHDLQPICARDGLMLTHDGALCHRAHPDACRRCVPEMPMARHALRAAHLRAVLGGIDLLVAPSRFVARRFADWGLPEARIAVVPNGVPAADAPELPARGDRFAFFGNIAAHKGIDVLLDAAAHLARVEAELAITVHGGFTWAAPEARERFAHGIERAAPLVRHAGPYDRADLPRLMARTDWVVVPSTWWENAPLVILEAQRAGRPVICSGIGGMAELVEDGVTGLHVPPGDAMALAETLIEAADVDLCRRLAASTLPPPDPDAMADAYLGHYRQLLQEVPA